MGFIESLDFKVMESMLECYHNGVIELSPYEVADMERTLKNKFRALSPQGRARDFKKEQERVRRNIDAMKARGEPV